MAALSRNRWLKWEAVPIIIATGGALTMSCFMMSRNLVTNPEVRVSKETRAAGVLENHEEGEDYANFFVRRYVQQREPLMFPKVNKYFLDKFYSDSN